MQTQQIATAVSIPAIHSALAAPATSVRFATIKQAAVVRPVFTEAAFRDIRFKAFDRKNSRGEVIKGNGSGEFGCWIEVGGKVLLDLPRFDAWLESHKVRAGQSHEASHAPLQVEGWGGNGVEQNGTKRIRRCSTATHPPPGLPVEGGGDNASGIQASTEKVRGAM